MKDEDVTGALHGFDISCHGNMSCVRVPRRMGVRDHLALKTKDAAASRSAASLCHLSFGLGLRRS